MNMQRFAAAILGCLLATPALLHAMQDEGGGDRPHDEASLLHRRIDLSGLVHMPGARSGWRKLSLPPAPVTVLNLWSRSCKPCLEELPALGQLMAQNPAVPFVFAADPPEETSRDDIARFWARPIVDLPPGRCHRPIGEPPALGGPLACRLLLPDAPPARSEDARLMSSLDGIAARPITLLLDGNGVVRQAFVGSLLTRIDGSRLTRMDQLRAGIARLRALSTPPQAAAGPQRRR